MGVVSPLTSHVAMEGPGCTGGRVRGRTKSPRTKNSRGPGARQRRSRLGGYKTICLNNRARSRRQANSSGDSGWAATAMCFQGQAINYP